MNESAEERKYRLNEMHSTWLDVTSTALAELHKTNGYKGAQSTYKAELHIDSNSVERK